MAGGKSNRYAKCTPIDLAQRGCYTKCVLYRHLRAVNKNVREWDMYRDNVNYT